jgi:Ran GTPase-activating protein (RanGAP) involved in mRNA processing and transport
MPRSQPQHAASSAAAAASFGALPDELLGVVISHCTVPSLCSLSETSVRCRRLVRARMQAAISQLAALPRFVRLTRPPNPTTLLTIEHLSLPNAAIDGARVSLLAAAMSAGALPMLTDLDLSSNSIGDTGMSALAGAIRRGALFHITHLSLSRNCIEDAGAGALADAVVNVGRVRRLRSLYLNSNRLGDDGVARLARALKRSAIPELRTLALQYNEHIGERGSEELRSAANAGGLHRIAFLNLGGTMVGEAARQRLEKAIQDNVHKQSAGRVVI